MCTDVSVKLLPLAILLIGEAGFSEMQLHIWRAVVCYVFCCSYTV